MRNNNATFWRGLCAVMALMLIGISIYEISKDKQKSSPAADKTAVVEEAALKGDETLTFWNDCDAKNELIDYVEDVTKEGDADYIPAENRIAVFDMDGTLFCETDPTFFEWNMYVYRVLEDPDYKDKATKEQIDLANRFKATFKDRATSAELDQDHAKLGDEIFKGMTLDEYSQFVKAFMDQPAPSYDGMTRGEAFYQPMIQVISYLKSNGFKVYICSGTDRFTLRELIADKLDIPAEQVIGTDPALVADHQEKEDDPAYDYSAEDELVRGEKMLGKNVEMNKVENIMQEIGKQPVLAFGNSGGDYSMAEFTITENPYTSKAFMVCCDDLERENGSNERADTVKDACQKNGWIPISMKDDWNTIYGEGVTYHKK